MLHQMAKWLSSDGKDSDIVISSRARLARNLQNVLFVERAGEDQLKDVLDNVLNAAEDSETLGSAYFFDMTALDELDRHFFAERRLISADFIEMDSPRGFLVTADEATSVMINEEDHLRIQNIAAGFSLDETWQNVHRVDQELAGQLTYAFSDRFGYLTACPSNVGTGVRFSVFIHLPVLTLTKQIEDVFAETIPAGIAVRGFYGEGSKVIGNFFQISNQYTLGWTEQGILDRVKPIIERFISLEREAREKVMRGGHITIEDKIGRAKGLISHARILSSMEFLDLVSALRLGADLGILTEMERKSFNELLVLTQPAHIQKDRNKTLTERERDIVRAELVREKLHLN
jgi:protein arginine kinase